MCIKIHFYEKLIEIDGKTFKNRILDIETGELWRYMNVCLNKNNNFELAGVNTLIHKGYAIHFLPSVTGG